MSVQPYQYDTRPPKTMYTIYKNKAQAKPVSGMYRLYVPQLNATIYKPIDYQHNKLMPDSWNQEEFDKASNRAKAAAEKQAAFDLAEFNKRHGNIKQTRKQLNARMSREAMSRSLANDKRFLVGKRYGEWEIIGALRLETEMYTRETKAVTVRCSCGHKQSIIARALIAKNKPSISCSSCRGKEHYHKHLKAERARNKLRKGTI